MKHYVIIIILAILLTSGVVFGMKAKKKMSDAMNLEPAIDFVKFDIKNYQDVIAGLLSGYNVKVGFGITNRSDSAFDVESLKADIYALDGTLIASQSNIVSDISIESKNKTVVGLDYLINARGIYKIGKQLDISDYNGLIDLFQNYLNTEMLGTQVIVKGHVTVRGYDFNFNEKINI